MYITIDSGAFPACDGRSGELAAMSSPKGLALAAQQHAPAGTELFACGESRRYFWRSASRTMNIYFELRPCVTSRGRLVELAREKPRFGYRRLHVLLRRVAKRTHGHCAWAH